MNKQVLCSLTDCIRACSKYSMLLRLLQKSGCEVLDSESALSLMKVLLIGDVPVGRNVMQDLFVLNDTADGVNVYLTREGRLLGFSSPISSTEFDGGAYQQIEKEKGFDLEVVPVRDGGVSHG